MIVTLLTSELGKVSAIARYQRRSKPRPGVLLEPIHTLRVILEENPGVEMMVLRESRLERVRHHLTRQLDALEAAGQGLRWVRALVPSRVAEPHIWAEIESFLDALDQHNGRSPRKILAGLGLWMLRAVGYGFEWRACARCGKPCPEGASAWFDARQGGLICRACGGGSLLLRPELRQAFLRAEEGDLDALPDLEIEPVLGWIDVALVTHLSIGEQKG